MLGTIALFAGTFSWSSWFLLQSKVGKKYPALYSGTALIFSLSFLQAAALSFSIERGLSIWAFKSKVEIITVIFSVSNLELSHFCITLLLTLGNIFRLMLCTPEMNVNHKVDIFCYHVAYFFLFFPYFLKESRIP